MYEIELIRKNQFVFREAFTYPKIDILSEIARQKILMKFLIKIQEMRTKKEAKDILAQPLITKLDHTTFGFQCDSPERFESLKSVYQQFRKSFGVDKKPIKG